MAFYYHCQARVFRAPLSDRRAFGLYSAVMMKSAEHAGKAAALYPADDECRCGASGPSHSHARVLRPIPAAALARQVISLFRCGRPLRESLPVCEQLGQAMKEKREIWRVANDMSGGQLDRDYDEFVGFAAEARLGVAAGQYTLNDPVVTNFVEQIPWV